jgi:hypothetical protein
MELSRTQYGRNGKLPYSRMMEILASKGMRGQLEKLMASDQWDRASAGTPTYPGGERERLVKDLKDRLEQEALSQMLREWKDTPLPQRYEAARYVLPKTARYHGPGAEDALREKVGLPAPR